MIIDDAKALLLSHESQIEKRRIVKISPLSSVNLSVEVVDNNLDTGGPNLTP